jgi:hypothetical protein
LKLFQESSRKSDDKRFSPPKTLAEEVSIHDLSNSILEVSSTVPSFSSPEVQEQDESITEIISPEPARAPAVAQLSAAEIMRLREDLDRQKLLLKSSNLKSLPDGGARIKENQPVNLEYILQLVLSQFHRQQQWPLRFKKTNFVKTTNEKGAVLP